MKKLLIILIPLVLLALLPGALVGGYFLFIKDSDDDSESNQAASENNDADGDTIDSNGNEISEDKEDLDDAEGEDRDFTSVADVFSVGDSLECSWNYDESDYNVNGVMYVSDNKMKQEFVSDSEKSSILYLDGEIYFWSDTTSEGLKMSALEDGTTDDIDDALSSLEAYAALYGGLGMSDEYNFDCNSWKADSSKFEVPSDINFLDLSDLSNLVDSYL